MDESPLRIRGKRGRGFESILAHLQELTSPREVLSVLIRRAVNDYGFPWGCLFLLDGDTKLIESYPSSKPHEERLLASKILHLKDEGELSLGMPASFLVIPIQTRRKVLGFMALEKGKSLRETTIEELRILGSVAGGSVNQIRNHIGRIRRISRGIRTERKANRLLFLKDLREMEERVTRDLKALTGCRDVWLVTVKEGCPSFPSSLPEGVMAFAKRALNRDEPFFMEDLASFPLVEEGKKLGMLIIMPKTLHRDSLPMIRVYCQGLSRALAGFLKGYPVEARYRGIMASPLLCVFQLDSEGIITFINSSFALTLGYPLREANRLLGKKVWEMIHPSCLERMKESLDSLRRGERGLGVLPITLVDGEGNSVFMLVSFSPLRGGWGVLGVAIDITEKEKLLKNLEERNRELQTFAYSAAHELKGPFLYLKKVVSQPSLEGFPLEELRWAVARLESTLKHLTAYSFLDNRSVTVESTSPHLIIQGIWNDLAREVGITMDISIGVPPLMKSDAFLLELIFRNLLRNAQKYGIKGDPPRVDVECVRRGKGYLFSVRDYGEGFPPKKAQEIFEPFVRLHPEKKGTGLGLTIVKKAVEKLGGKIWAEGALGKGTVFYFTHPIL